MLVSARATSAKLPHATTCAVWSYASSFGRWITSASVDAGGADVAAADSGKPAVVDEDPSWPKPPGVASSVEVLCTPGTGKAGMFTDVATAAGFDLVRPQFWPTNSAFPKQQVQEGGGQAVADFNGDGALDIYAVVATGDDHLFLGTPGAPWQFVSHAVNTVATEETSATAADLEAVEEENN